jgi:two-component system C4-dicarboxylate transport response regulator DctD
MRTSEAQSTSVVLIGRSRELEEALALARRYARTNEHVFLLGETGVGKSRVARLIHEASGRRGAFVVVPGGQLVETLYHSQLSGYAPGAYTGGDRRGAEGAFERARDGTVALEDLQLWGLGAQAAVLQALEEHYLTRIMGRRDVVLTCRAVICSTQSLESLRARGLLLEDLEYRLGDFCVEVPHLRRRRIDIAVLAYHVLDALRIRTPGGPGLIDPDALEHLLLFDWPGNVRQLQNAVTRAFVHAHGEQRIRVPHLPSYAVSAPLGRLDPALRAELALWAFERTGRRRSAAELLGVHPNTIDYHRRRNPHKQDGGSLRAACVTL